MKEGQATSKNKGTPVKVKEEKMKSNEEGKQGI